MKRINNVFMLLFFCIIFISCNDDDAVIQRNKAVKKLYNEQNTIKIAVADSFEKKVSAAWNGIFLAKEVIESEKLLGKELELLKFDDGGDAIIGSNVAYQIASDNEICAVIGHGFSDISLPASTIYQYYGILMFNTSSTLPRLTMNNNPLIVRNIPDDNLLGKKAAELCDEKKYKRVLIYYLNMASPTTFANSFEFNSMEKGITVVSRDSYELSSQKADFQHVFEKWKKDFEFDAVLLAGTNPEIGEIVNYMRESGISCPIIGSDSFESDLFKKTLTDKENGRIFVVSNFNRNSGYPAYQDFHDLYMKEYSSEPDYEAMQAYDAMMVLAKSIKMAGSADASEIVKVMKANRWEEAAGPYSFAQNGDIENHSLFKKVFNNGEFVEIN